MARRPSAEAGRQIASLAGLCLLWLPEPAAAAASAEAWDSEPALESVVVTATRIEQSVLDVAEGVSVIDSEDIRQRAPELLAEMLRGVPGAFFQQTTPGQGIPIIRGLKGSQVLHLVDGMRLNNAFFRDAPNQYLGLVDAYAAERTEVVRGSAPSLHGADAMGGVVQVLTGEPELSGTEWRGQGSFYAAYNSADSSLIGRADAAAGNADTVLSGGITYQDHGNRTTGGPTTVRPSGYRLNAADLKWRHQVDGRSELMLSLQYLEQPSTPRVDELVPGFGQDHPSSEQYEFRPNRREFLHARYTLESTARWFSRAQVHLARQTITDDRLTQEFGASEIMREFNSSRLDGLTLQVNSPWGATGGSDRELVWGAEYYADEINSSRFRSAASGGSGDPVAARFPDGSTMDSVALYAANHWSWERLAIDAGLRYSRFEIFLPDTAELSGVRLTPTNLTGDLHGNYEMAPGLHLVANVGRGFRPPNVFDLGSLGSRPGNRFNVPNPNLRSESVWSYDVGVKISRGAWRAEAFAWFADYRDKISSRLTGEVTPEGRQVVRSDNLNRARLYGFEGGLRYLAGEAIELYAVLNYTWGEESGPEGNTAPADRIPPFNGRLGLVWNPRERWRVEPYVDWAGSQDRLSPRDLEDPRIDPAGSEGWATMNLLTSWQATDAATLGLKLQNIADQNYREHGSGIDAAGRNLGFWLDYVF